MTQIQSYLFFNGSCREAMTFYQNALGGELSLQTIGESPMSEQMPETMKNAILHARLSKNGLVLMASDMMGEKGLMIGNNISMMLNCETEAEARAFYEKLAAGGEATHPLENTFWGALLGDLQDPFGHRWMVNFQAPVHV